MTPFATGYALAALETLAEIIPAGHWDTDAALVDRFDAGTVAAILKDCAAFENYATGLGLKTGETEGRRFWKSRRAGSLPGAWGAAFPPHIVRLGGDGRVVLA